MIAAYLNDYPRNDLQAALEDLGLDVQTRSRLDRAFAWLAAQDPAAVNVGRNDIDSDDVFANVMDFSTTPASEKEYEAHRSYIDVHYVFFGEEMLGCAPIGACTPTQPFSEDDDFGLFSADPARESWVVSHPGSFVICLPEDAHKPGCCVGGPARLVKACVKVRIG